MWVQSGRHPNCWKGVILTIYHPYFELSPIATDSAVHKLYSDWAKYGRLSLIVSNTGFKMANTQNHLKIYCIKCSHMCCSLLQELLTFGFRHEGTICPSNVSHLGFKMADISTIKKCNITFCIICWQFIQVLHTIGF